MPNKTREDKPKRPRKSRTVVGRLKPNQSQDEAAAEMMVNGVAMNAITAAVGFSKTLGELDVTECLGAFLTEIQRVQSGNLRGPEALLSAQAITLNAMFTQLAYHTSKMTIVDQIDRFTRLALKAQGQCRATLETLAAIKNPTTVFTRQANIAQGPQQVNNTVALARAGNSESAPNELLEAHDERLDRGTASAAGGCDRALATVGTFHRPTHD